jgi:hypothetical protein
MSDSTPQRQLLLLSPYRVPGQNALYLGHDDMAAFLNGLTALWHPAAARGAASAPKVASQYDHEQPTAGCVYAVPESPPLMLPDDWDQRVRDAGAVAFRTTPDRAATLANLKDALGGDPEAARFFDVPGYEIAVFFGLGFGFAMLEALFEAMEHDNLIPVEQLWQDVQQAVRRLAGGEEGPWYDCLRAAAEKLLTAREQLYQATIYLLDMSLLDEGRLAEPFPASFDFDLPCNLVAPSALLEKLAREQPDRFARLKERVTSEKAEVCGGCYLEREDALLPVESQLWNLRKGLTVAAELLGQDVRVFGRKRFAAHPQLPLLLSRSGLRRALFLAFDESVLPSHRATVINWPSPDGQQVEAFTRAPVAADSPHTFFHAAHHLHRSIMQDHSATLALLHKGPPAAWYTDLLQLCKLAPVLGQFVTFSRYFNEVLAGEYISSPSADEFHGDYLNERTTAHSPQPVSGFVRLARWRRRLDAVWTLAAVHRGLAGAGDALGLDERLAKLEEQVETLGADVPAETPELIGSLNQLQKEVGDALAARLLGRAPEGKPGYLLLNPCSFSRRVALEVPDITTPIPVEGPVKACQVGDGSAKLVVEVPALGFAWFPRGGQAGPPPKERLRLADDRAVRNEFFEAEIDPQTGGLRGIRDHRTRINRIGQQLVFNPGCVTRAKSVKATSSGPAYGEVVAEGAILDEQQKVLATFRQRYRAWVGRPVLEMRIEIFPEHQPQGYPWHAYYGARFAWRDERCTLLRGVNGSGTITTYTRPETPDYLEVRLGRESTVLLTGGLPFHQRHGGRMLDVILIPEGETARAFDIGVGMDRDYPMQTALGTISPAPLVAVEKGPPHVGAAGWLFHLDMPNAVLLGMRPAPAGSDGVLARVLECSGHGGQVEMRCVRDPQRAMAVDVRGLHLSDVTTYGDVASFGMTQGDLVQLRVDFST